MQHNHSLGTAAVTSAKESRFRRKMRDRDRRDDSPATILHPNSRPTAVGTTGERNPAEELRLE
jgi:hypothetical protein